MKIFSIVSVLVSFSFISYAQDFRKSFFGDSVAEVLDVEGEPDDIFIHGEDSTYWLIYHHNIRGVACKMIYAFADNKLIRFGYDLTNGDVLNERSFPEWEQVEAYLREIHGIPMFCIDYRSSEEFKDQVQIASEWRWENLTVHHSLSTSNFHIVDYLYKGN